MATPTIHRVRARRPHIKRKGGEYVRLAPKGGQRIRKAREDKRWSQRDLAQLVRRKHNTIGLLERERGMTSCTRQLAEDICFHLGIALDYAFIVEDEDEQPAPRTRKAAA